MLIRLDPDIDRVAEFMLRAVPAAKLYRVAHDLAKLADLLWQEVPPGERYHPFQWEYHDAITAQDVDRLRRRSDTTPLDHQQAARPESISG